MKRAQTLVDRLEGHVKHGDHLCVICNTPEERLEMAVQYIADGLRQNERVVYAADPGTVASLLGLLEQRGVDVRAEMARGALSFPTADEAYLRNGEFNPDQIYAEFEQAIEDALTEGFAGCRFAGEPVWAIDRAELRPGLIEFENRLNELFSRRKAAGLCVYDQNAWPAEVVRDVLRTHPVAVVGDLICSSNPYYERPDLVDPHVDPRTQVRWMVEQLRQLRLQESRLQIALEAGQLGSWELDLKTDTSVRTLRHDQIFGYDHVLPHWGYDRFLQHVLPEDRERVNRALRDALEHGATWQFECRIRRHGDGAIRWIEAHGRPDPDGTSGEHVERLLGIVADTTERKEMEETLREADRRKDEFLATLAHELRNPLAPILNVLHLLQEKAGADPELKGLHDVMDRQTRHLARLVDDLLDVSRITTGRIALQQHTLDLNGVLRSALEASEPLMRTHGHTLDLQIPDAPIAVTADPVRLSQVFLNILNNAAKYTPAGGRIELRVEQETSGVRVCIRDNGIGISPALLPTIFNMFVRGGRAGEQAQGGLGVGLPLARQLVELQGGTLTARSDGRGRGSEFIVFLPMANQAQGAPEIPSPVWRGAGDERILVVDDNVDAADSLALSLELHGYQVKRCYDGSSALALLPEFDPVVVILDIGLPDIDGYEVARRARIMKPEALLVALTGWGQEEDRKCANAAGFNLHMTKPVSPAELLRVIQACCQRQGPSAVPLASVGD